MQRNKFDKLKQGETNFRKQELESNSGDFRPTQMTMVTQIIDPIGSPFHSRQGHTKQAHLIQSVLLYLTRSQLFQMESDKLLTFMSQYIFQSQIHAAICQISS